MLAGHWMRERSPVILSSAPGTARASACPMGMCSPVLPPSTHRVTMRVCATGRWRSSASVITNDEGDDHMTNPLLELKALGQSIWLDDIDRGDLLSGRFRRLIDEDGLAGATGNPTIFE